MVAIQYLDWLLWVGGGGGDYHDKFGIVYYKQL